MNNFFCDFNEKQLQAVKSNEKTICVFAGPGTGKTKTLVGRYVYLIEEEKVHSANILCLTFTKKAAEEMEQKIRSACGDNHSKFIGTIHSIGNRILREDLIRLGFPNNYSIIPDDDQHNVIFDIMNEMNLYEDESITFKDLVTYISEKKIKNNSYVELLLNNSAIIYNIQKINEKILVTSQGQNLIDLKFEKVFYKYLLVQSQNYYLDFNDLILVCNYLFANNNYSLNKWSKKFEHVLVDEFQDLTDEEYKLIKYLSSYHGRIFGVGDPDQSIYKFRGSSVEIFNKFYQSCAAKFDFEENYRSYQEIINLSHDLISANTDRVVDVKLHCNKGFNKVPHIVHTIDRSAEATFILEKIQIIHKSGFNYSDCAILYRNNQSSLVIEEYFQSKKIPYKVYSTNEFFRCEEVKTAIAYIKFVIYKDNVSFLKVCRKFNKYISNVMINHIKEVASDMRVSYWQVILEEYKNPFYKNNFTQFVEFVKKIEDINPNEDFEDWCIKIFNNSGFLKYVFSTGDEDKANHIKQLIDMIHVFEPEDSEKNIAEEFLSYITLLADGDVAEETDKVKMMSIHCSKGLQFKYVFLIDFNEGYIPSSKTESKEDFAEERRIAYVAFTRAEEELFILESKGDDGRTQISSFSNTFQNENYDTVQYIATEKENIRKINIGAEVKSKFFGKGIVKAINLQSKKCIVQFADVYREKEVNIDSLMNVINKKELSFPIDQNIVAEIKKYHPSDYSIGEIVMHSQYGAGIITKIKDKNNAFVQFKDIGSIFDLNSNHIVKRNDYLKYRDGV